MIPFCLKPNHFFMTILKNISTLYRCPDSGGQSELAPLKNGVLIWEDDRIVWVGKEENIPEKFTEENIIDAEGAIVIPGLIDCHTHLAFGGWRAQEFEMRLKGISYLEIAQSGGGILSTVIETRLATEDELFEKSLALLTKISHSGVTTLECKSGYGLSVDDELKLLRVYSRLREATPVQIVSTFLGAHTIPKEYADDRKRYIDLVINKMIPAVADQKLATFCDVFIEESAFTIDEARVILKAGMDHGLKPKLHADQLSSGGGAELAAEIGAVSADHLEQISEMGIQKMAEFNVVGVTLPTASLYTRQPYLNCRKLVDGGVNVAIATDFNPGSAPTFDLELAMMLTCNHGRLTPDECLKGVTINAAKALDLQSDTGSLEAGKKADFILLDSPDINYWLYHYKGSRINSIFKSGKKIRRD